LSALKKKKIFLKRNLWASEYSSDSEIFLTRHFHQYMKYHTVHTYVCTRSNEKFTLCTLHYTSMSLYGSTALCRSLDAFSVSRPYIQSEGLLGRGISPSQDRYLHIGQHKHRVNAHRHPCFKYDSNPRSQRLSGRRQFMP
jgi:hypothetical protein